MTDIQLAIIHYDVNGAMPYADLVVKALREKMECEAPPKPLTIGDLQMRDRKPVWCESVDPYHGTGWHLASRFLSGRKACVDSRGNRLWFDSYGTTWFAYDREPKEVAP